MACLLLNYPYMALLLLWLPVHNEFPSWVACSWPNCNFSCPYMAYLLRLLLTDGMLSTSAATFKRMFKKGNSFFRLYILTPKTLLFLPLKMILWCRGWVPRGRGLPDGVVCRQAYTPNHYIHGSVAPRHESWAETVWRGYGAVQAAHIQPTTLVTVREQFPERRHPASLLPGRRSEQHQWLYSNLTCKKGNSYSHNNSTTTHRSPRPNPHSSSHNKISTTYWYFQQATFTNTKSKTLSNDVSKC